MSIVIQRNKFFLLISESHFRPNSEPDEAEKFYITFALFRHWFDHIFTHDRCRHFRYEFVTKCWKISITNVIALVFSILFVLFAIVWNFIFIYSIAIELNVSIKCLIDCAKHILFIYHYLSKRFFITHHSLTLTHIEKKNSSNCVACWKFLCFWNKFTRNLNAIEHEKQKCAMKYGKHTKNKMQT